MVQKIYGRFMAEQADRDRWELRATDMDAVRSKEQKERAEDFADRNIAPIVAPPRTRARPSNKTKCKEFLTRHNS